MVFFGSSLPPIMVGEGDRHDLLVLAMSRTGLTAGQADDLLNELERAAVVDDEALPLGVVRMGSTVTVRIDGGDAEELRLAYPHDREPDSLSVFSSIGTALIGLRAGQSMRWTDRDGRSHDVQVFSVNNDDI